MRTKDLKSSKGITLIALVVTIIVLLILAGVSIMMLTGDNGILKNAQQTSTENAYKGAEEQVKLAYAAVKTEIMAKTVANGTYNPIDDTGRLAEIIKNDLGIPSDSDSNGIWTVDDAIDGIIKIEYKDSKIDKGVIGATQLTTPNGELEEISVPRNEGVVTYQITLYKEQDAKLFLDIEDSITEASENIYVTLYTDGTLAFDNNPNTVVGKEIEPGTDTWNITGIDYDGFENQPPWLQNNLDEKILEVDFLNKILPTSTSMWFAGCENLTSIKHIANLNTKNVTNMSGMFYVCSKLKNLDVSKFNTDNVSDMSWMFAFCRKLETLNLGKINTGNVTNMSYMFLECMKLNSIDVSNFNTSKVEDMRYLFMECFEIETININNFVIKNDCDISGMFSACTSLKNIYAEKSVFENKGDISDAFGDDGPTNVVTSPTNGIVFGYTIEKNLGWYANNNGYLVRSARQDRASTNRIHLNPNKKYKITMKSENFDFGCMNNPRTYDSGWVLPGSITIENFEYIALNFGYQRAHTGTITDSMLEEIINNIEIKVIE